MKKEEVLRTNIKIVEFIQSFINDFELNSAQGAVSIGKSERLYNCNASVYQLPGFKILKSYETVIAIYDEENNTVYDILRLIYGYTATSAQHISKFQRFVGNEHTKMLRWYEI